MRRRERTYTKLAQDLAQVARFHGLIYNDFHKPPFYIYRTRAGYWQKSSGAFLFTLNDSEGHEIFGSCDRVTEILKAHKEKRLSYFNEYGTATLIVEVKQTREYDNAERP